MKSHSDLVEEFEKACAARAEVLECTAEQVRDAVLDAGDPIAPWQAQTGLRHIEEFASPKISAAIEDVSADESTLRGWMDAAERVRVGTSYAYPVPSAPASDPNAHIGSREEAIARYRSEQAAHAATTAQFSATVHDLAVTSDALADVTKERNHLLGEIMRVRAQDGALRDRIEAMRWLLLRVQEGMTIPRALLNLVRGEEA